MRMFIEFSRSDEVSRSISSETELISDVVVLGGNLAQPRLHRHQFAHQIHKLVQLGGRHAQADRVVGRVVGAPSAAVFALVFQRAGRHLGRARLLKLPAPSSPRMRCRNRDRLQNRLDAQFATVLDKDKDIANRIALGRRGQHHLPTDVAALRVQLRQRRNRRHAGPHRQAAQSLSSCSSSRGLAPFSMNSAPGAKWIDHSRAGPEESLGLDSGPAEVLAAASAGAWPFLGRLASPACRSDAALCSESPRRPPDRPPARLPSLFQHRPDLIERRERQIDQLRADLQPPVAHLVEGRLQIVREGGHILEAEHRPRAFERVQRAEDPPHQLLVGAVVVQLQQRRFQIDKNLAALFPEGMS